MFIPLKINYTSKLKTSGNQINTLPLFWWNHALLITQQQRCYRPHECTHTSIRHTHKRSYCKQRAALTARYYRTSRVQHSYTLCRGRFTKTAPLLCPRSVINSSNSYSTQFDEYWREYGLELCHQYIQT